MATVTGITYAKAQQLVGATVASAAIDSGTGHLIFTRINGSQNDAGKVLDPLLAYPVGSLYFSDNATNPSTLLGGGTWARFAAGRMVIGVDDGDTDFNAFNKTGGEKAHTLITSEMPVHNHGVSDPGHAHFTGLRKILGLTYNTLGGGGQGDVFETNSNPGASNAQNTAVSATGVTTQNAGTGNPHNNLPPYIAVYIWRRTA